MSRVVVLEPTNKDLSAAQTHGELVYLFGPQDTRPSIWETDDFMLAVQERLEKINFSADDYLLCVGHQVPLMTTMHLLSNVYDQYKVLFWHATVQEYVPREFSSGCFTF